MKMSAQTAHVVKQLKALGDVPCQCRSAEEITDAELDEALLKHCKHSRDQLLELYGEIAYERFLKEHEKAGHPQIGVCGIDLNDKGQYTKLTAALQCGKELT